MGGGGIGGVLVWAGVLAVAAAVFFGYLRAFRGQRSGDRVRLDRNREAGMDRAAGQYPLIDTNACIGCGTCVAACPEGDVLGVVMGRATVINGSRCIGHGQCALACPVGAIEVGLGDITTRDDIPLLDDENQTSVPGLWIAGELSGFALINNAVEQGRRVAEAIERDLSAGPSPTEPQDLDLVIVGAGPAGMAAGLVALDQGLKTLVIDQQGAGGTILHYPRRKLVMVQPVEIPRLGRLPRREYSKEELLEIWEGLHREQGLEILTQLRVTDVEGEKGNFTVRAGEKAFRASHVVLALGRRGTPRRLNVPGEDSAKVAYRLIDAEAYRGRRVLVVGGGDSAVEAAMGLAHQEGCQVTISYRKDEFLRIKQRNQERLETMLEAGRIRFLPRTTVDRIESQSVHLKGDDGPVEIPNDEVFILAGGIPPFAFLRNLGIRFGGEQPTAYLVDGSGAKE